MPENRKTHAPTPEPWTCGAPIEFDHDRGRLVRAMHEYRAELLERHPLLQLPTDNPNVSTPVAALLLAWERWDFAHGPCPDCGAPALGTCFGGMLSVGSVSGVCTACGRVVTRFLRGIGAALAGAELSTRGTPYKFSFLNWGWTFRGIPWQLVAVLERLGATNLPEPSIGKPDRRGAVPMLLWTKREQPPTFP